MAVNLCSTHLLIHLFTSLFINYNPTVFQVLCKTLGINLNKVKKLILESKQSGMGNR